MTLRPHDPTTARLHTLEWHPQLRTNQPLFTKRYRWLRQQGFSLFVAFLLLGGVVLRIGFLDWQPLWADEGYSIYFATESVARIWWLTARDIHPPFYYLLLHGWITWGTTAPIALRVFSVLLALPVLWLGLALARTLFGGRQRPQLFFLLLLVLNPFYLYYSQEIRMYGLALTVSMAASLCCWQWVQGVQQGRPVAYWLVGYVVTATLALYTLYYLAFLLLAHLLWVGWELHRQVRRLLHFGLAAALIALLYLPWVIYTARILVAYVNDKIRSDQDVALGPWRYLTHHLLSFTSGHLPFPTPVALLPWLAFWGGIGLLLWSLWVLRLRFPQRITPTAQRMLWLCFTVPFAMAFLVNRVYPFFPVGGERLLLFLLPYFLLLIAGALDDLWAEKTGGQWLIGRVALLILLMPACVGIWLFYTLPRYQENDYRPLVRQLVQQGTDRDTVLATFPWQVGFWRAYAPLAGLSTAAGPQIRLISERSVQWGPAVITLMDEALARGMLWIPSLRSIGSTLPADMEHYLAGHAVNFEHRWVGLTTLDAWHQPTPHATHPLAVDWGDIKLASGGVSTTTLAAANAPLLVTLGWQRQAAFPAAGVTLRLQKEGRTWAYRDYAAVGTFVTRQSDGLVWEQVGLLVPAGLPPGDYQLVVGLVDTNQTLRQPIHETDPTASLAPVTTITITAPNAPVPPFRLPIQTPLSDPALMNGVALLGSSSGDLPVLAGTFWDLTLFWQKQVTAGADYHLYVSLLDAQGAGVAGWEGWPLPDYSMAQWSAGALTQTPLAFFVPGAVVSGEYRLLVGLLDPISGTKMAPIGLRTITVQQRKANFTPVQPPHPLSPLVQFGTHVQLLGYDRQTHDDQIALTLYWQVLQPLLPPHRIFVHWDAADGATLAQTDDIPQTAGLPAPTGSWQPGEYLVTHHLLTTSAVAERSQAPDVDLRVGIYLPATGARLPITIADEPAGDALLLPAP